MDTKRWSQPALLFALVVSVGIFVGDLLVPLGYAIGIFHVVPVLMAAWSRVSWHLWAVAAVATGLALLDLWIGRPGERWELVLTNRLLSIATLWLVALLSHLLRRAGEQGQKATARHTQTVQTMIDAAPDGMLLIDAQGRITQANPAAERMFGYAAGALQGLSVNEPVPMAAREAHGEQMRGFHQGSKSGAMAPGRQISGLRKDGTSIPLEISLGKLNDEQSKVIAALRDVSERHAFEERLRATQRMEAIGRLAGGVAHDFNNMLAAIICNGQLARKALPEGSEALEDVNELLSAADRAADLTRQLLAFSRRQIIAPRNVDLNDLVQQVHKMLGRLLGANITQELVLAPKLGTVRIDASQLEQVLLNLAVNARDAMPDGGTLTIETKDVTLDEAYAREHPEVTPGDYVMLAVSDTGHGMTPEVRVRIFEPFFTTKAPGVGTGLGLATLYGIVKQAGGHIWVYSEPGKGTTFRVYFPKADGTAEAVRLPRGQLTPMGGTETVLLVEDEAGLRRILVRTLRVAGYGVLEAANGEDALLKLQSFPGLIDLLLTDVVMPQMGGVELAKRVHERQPHVAVLYASGYTENAIVHNTQLDPDVVFLQKPFTPDEVLRRVRQVLDAVKAAAKKDPLSSG